MKRRDSFHNASTSERNLLVPMLLITLVLHGAFLMLPISADPKKTEPSEEKMKAQLQPVESPSLESPVPRSLPQPLNTQIDPRLNSPTHSRQQLASQRFETEFDARSVSQRAKPIKASDRTSSQNNQRTRSQSTSTRTHQQPVNPAVSRRQASNAESSSNSSQGQKAPTPSNSSQEQRASGIPTFAQQRRPLATSNLPQATKQPEIPQPSQPAVTLSEPFFRDFPYYLGSLLTSGGVLKSEFDDPKEKYIYHTVDELEKVAANFEKQLTEKGFTVTKKTNEDTFKVYEVSRGSTTQFLHFIFKDEKTAIFLDAKEHNLNELEQEKVGNSLPALIQFYDTFKEKVRDNPDLRLQKLKQSDLDRFPESEVLKATNKEAGELELDTLLLEQLEAIASPSHSISLEQLASSITSHLSHGEDGFKVEKVGSHAGGELYEVTKDNFKIYMILVSSQAEEAPRTAVLLSKEDPRTL